MATLTVKTTDGAVTEVEVPDDYEVDAHTADNHLHWPGGYAHLADVEDATVKDTKKATVKK